MDLITLIRLALRTVDLRANFRRTLEISWTPLSKPIRYRLHRSIERAELRALLIDMAERGGAAVLDSQSGVAIHRADSRPRLTDIAVPALVLCDAQDRVRPPEVHREMADLIPDATLAVIPDARHFAPIESPDAVATYVRAWLAAPATLSNPPPA